MQKDMYVKNTSYWKSNIYLGHLRWAFTKVAVRTHTTNPRAKRCMFLFKSEVYFLDLINVFAHTI